MDREFPGRLSHWMLATATILAIGCGDTQSTMMSKIDSMEFGEAETVAANATSIPAGPFDSAGGIANSKLATRKIIYTTSLGLVVKDYQDFEKTIGTLVAKHGGFIANSRTDRRYNNRQSGTWTVRVPVDRYNDFLSGVSSIGFAESREENAADVTEEYVDVEARIKNKRVLEERIITMLTQRSGKLSEALEIERELSRVREEIERMEGRLRYLKDQTSLATVTITCREERAYTPPTAPTLSSRITGTWSSSIDTLIDFAEVILLVIVGLTPWIVATLVPLALAWKIAKRWLRRRREKAGLERFDKAYRSSSSPDEYSLAGRHQMYITNELSGSSGA